MAETALGRAHLLLLLAPAALLGGAFAFQHIGGLHPCEMCVWQRWPHALALVAGTAALLLPAASRRWPLLLAALAVVVTGSIGVYHAGVEQRWWQGPSTCSATDLGSGDFLSNVLATPVVQCDQIAWSLAGISMAGYNAILSFLIAGVATWLLLKR
jgi:disulfide bond formation protein DsbB